MSVFRNLDCLSLVVCRNTTLLKLQTVLFLFFFQILHFEIAGAAYLWMRLIHGRLRYYLPQEILSHFSDVCYNNNYSIQGLIHLTMKQTCAWFNKIWACSFSNFIVNVLPQLVSLTCDGLTGAVQERMRAEHHVQSHHMMFNINLWSIGILAICKLRSLCMSKRPADKWACGLQ